MLLSESSYGTTRLTRNLLESSYSIKRVKSFLRLDGTLRIKDHLKLCLEMMSESLGSALGNIVTHRQAILTFNSSSVDLNETKCRFNYYKVKKNKQDYW